MENSIDKILAKIAYPTPRSRVPKRPITQNTGREAK